MTTVKHSFIQIFKRKEILLFLVLFIAGLSLAGWLMGVIIIASVSLRFIPIAPSTALLFFILSSLYIVNFTFEKSRIRQLITNFTVLLAALFCLLILVDYVFNFTWDIENVFITNPEKFGGVTIGRMSPITSMLFFFTCISILTEMSPNSKIIKYTGGSFSLLTFSISSVLLIGYLYKAPLLYGSHIIPVSLPSAICFLLFSVTLLRVSELKFWTFNLIKKNQTEFLLLKTFLPLVVFVVIFHGYLETNFTINQKNPTLISAIIILIIVVVTIFIIIRASAVLGKKLKRAETKLQESDEFSRTLLQTIPFAMDIVDENGIVLFQSENLKKHFEADAIGKNCWKLYRDDKTQCYDCPLRAGIKVGKTEVYETSGVLERKTFEIIHTGMMFEGRKAMLEIFIDITERKQVEQEVKLKNKQLLRLNSEKDKFFSIIAHDLRGPFSGFLGLTQIMAETLSSLTMTQIQELAISMKDSATNLHRLLENLLQWAKMQQGLIPFEPKVIQLSLVADEVMITMLDIAKNKNIELTSDIPDDLVVFADDNLLQTIFRNLLSNAVKFTPKGGKISLRANVSTDENIEISVKDTGIGMNREMVDDLFRPDVQKGRAGTEGELSTGLGLMLCKEFIEKHGGKIWVESEEENLSAVKAGGSVFYFTLPSKSGNDQIS